MLRADDLRMLFFEADFVRALKLVEEDVLSFKTPPLEETDTETLRFLCMAAEVLDQAGQLKTVKRILPPRLVQDCERALKVMPVWIGASQPEEEREKERKIDRIRYKQIAWVLLQYGFVLYRAGDLRQARERFDFVSAAVSSLAPDDSDDFPCFGIKSRIRYAIGLVHRQRHEYSQALKEFAESIDLASRRIHSKKPGTPFYQFSMARTLALGTAWIHYTAGNLLAARPLLDMSRALLQGKNERFISTYVEVIHACTSMSWRGTHKPSVERAIKQLEAAEGVFDTFKHSTYQLRTANELALGYLRLARLEGDATEKARLLNLAFDKSNLVVKSSSPRWQCNGLIVQSRIFREQHEDNKSLHAARTAANIAKEKEIRFCRIDSAIALGECYLSTEKWSDALAVFRSVEAQCADNHKEQAVVKLHIAKVYLAMKDAARAARTYKEAQESLAKVENAFISQLAEEVRLALQDNPRVFPLEMDLGVEKIDHREIERRLHGFLTEWAVAVAIANPKNNEPIVKRACNILGGISSAAFHNWRRDAGLTRLRIVAPPAQTRPSGRARE